MKMLSAALVVAVLLPNPARAQVAARDAAQITALQNCLSNGGQILSQSEGLVVDQANDEFAKLGFGAGYGGVFNLGSSRVEEAELVAGVVRVKEDDDIRFGPILELHKFMWPLKSERLVQIGADWVLVEQVPTACRRTGVEKKVALISMGPFIPLRLGDGLVESFGAGVAFGFRETKDDTSLNLGLAIVFDPRAQVLGEGIVPNQALPSGETQIRYRTTSNAGILAMFSVGW